MNETDPRAPEDPLDAHIDTASALVGLSIPEEHRAGVRAFLEVARQMEAALAALPPEDTELALAPVYRLPEPPEAET
ncbi:MAG: DUF4089 domain-containing protein [Pseudomonadota bacterium]